MKAMLPMLTLLVLSGCSSDSGSPAAVPLPEEPGEWIDYSAIEGVWSGWDHTADFAFDVTIEAGAPVGEPVGALDVLQPVGDGGLIPYCSIILKAASGDLPTYVFDGTVGSCTPTTVTFRHDADDDRIEVNNAQGESGYLLPGDDPGPPPE